MDLTMDAVYLRLCGPLALPSLPLSLVLSFLEAAVLDWEPQTNIIFRFNQNAVSNLYIVSTICGMFHHHSVISSVSFIQAITERSSVDLRQVEWLEDYLEPKVPFCLIVSLLGSTIYVVPIFLFSTPTMITTTSARSNALYLPTCPHAVRFCA